MKIRTGFVSNSSSSSFVCEVCGEIESAWDASLDEMGMYECVAEHIFCQGHTDDVEFEDVDEDDPNWDGETHVLSKYCPICKLTVLSDRDLTNYLLESVGKTPTEILVEVKVKYVTYEEFSKALHKRERND